MSMLKSIGFLLFISVVGVTGCQKEPGLSGKKVVTGTVYYSSGTTGTDEPAAAALIYITYDTKIPSGPYDQTTSTDSTGKYIINGLQKGDYFITAEYTDPQGFKYTTPGYSVAVTDQKKSKLHLNINLK